MITGITNSTAAAIVRFHSTWYWLRNSERASESVHLSGSWIRKSSGEKKSFHE